MRYRLGDAGAKACFSRMRLPHRAHHQAPLGPFLHLAVHRMAHRHRVLIPLCDQFRLAIVLLDRIRIEIEDNGLEPPRAIIEAAQRRLRPILLTTGTTVGGLIPLWLSGGLMWEPLAIAIMVGLLFATVLTLGIVPVLYSLFFRVRFSGFRYDTREA